MLLLLLLVAEVSPTGSCARLSMVRRLPFLPLPLSLLRVSETAETDETDPLSLLPSARDCEMRVSGRPIPMPVSGAVLHAPASPSPANAVEVKVLVDPSADLLILIVSIIERLPVERKACCC